MSRRIPVLLLTVLFLLGLAGTALAHATLTKASPEADAILNQAPTQIQLQFSEEVEAQFGAIAVYDHGGVRVDKGDAALDPRDVTRVLATLKPIGDGIYTVAWRVVSADGHPISGSYGFTVGKGIAGATYYKPDLPDPNGPPPLLLLAGYWLSAGGLMVLAGLGFTQGLIIRLAPDQRYRRWIWSGFWVSLAGTLIYLVSRTAQAAGIGLVDALQPTLLWRMLMTKSGQGVLLRLVILAWGLGLAAPLWKRWWFAFSVGILGLLTVSLGGHARALEQPLISLPLDWLHLVAAGVWAGGLLQFTFVLPPDLRRADGPLSEAVRRFGVVAGVAILVLIGTGLYPTLIHIPSMKALTQTAYGKTLITKVALFLPLLVLGAYNHFVTAPKLRKGEEGASGLLKQLSGAEMAIMAAVVGAAVLLTNLPPAKVALPPEELNVLIHSQRYASLMVMKPLLPGYRTLDLRLEAHDGTIPPDTKVSLELIMLDHDMGKNLNEPKLVGEGHYRFENVLLGMPGHWKLRLTVQRPGESTPEEITQEFVVPEAY